MQKKLLVGRVLSVVFIAACGSGDESDPVVPRFMGPGLMEGEPPPASGAPEAPGATDPSDGSAGPGIDADGEGMPEDLGLVPAAPAPADAPAVMPGAPPDGLGNGRLVGTTCTLVCADASTDADAQGNIDGWGFEFDQSCLVPGSELELGGVPCEIPGLGPIAPTDPVIPEGNVPRPAGNLSTGFFVFEGRLYDRLGSDFVMRGINHPVAWFQNSALDWMDEIATTGANSVRIVWETTSGSPQVLRASIERAVELGMVPMVELHDETGSNDVNGPTRMAPYYVDDLLEVLQEFEPYLLVNIANEWGAFFSSAESWLQA